MGMNLIQYRNELRRDLKDSGALWSDPELNRCVQRAVADLSRFLPLEQACEMTFEYNVDDESFTTPATASATAIVDTQSLTGVVDGDELSKAAWIVSPPRRLTVTLTVASVAAVTSITITVKGCDQDGNYAEESWYLKDLVSGTALQGKTHFKRVEKVVVTEIAGTLTGTNTVSVGTGNAYDSFVFLVNRPIKPESETVTSSPAGTAYTRDTDYYMDYINGGIKFINGGGMAAGTAYLISYDKSRIGINVSSILPIITRIQRVQYPADLVPQQFVSFNIIGDFMYIGSKKTGESQESLTSGEHIVIYYEREQMPPGEGSPGSYPGVLDEVICIGAGAYALLMMALKYGHQAVTDMAYVDDALDKVTDEMTSLDGELTNAGNVWTDEVKHILATAGIPNMEDFLELGDDSITITDILADVEIALDKIATEIEAGKTYLGTGDNKINTVNVGDNVPDLYRDYASVQVGLGGGYGDEASRRLNKATAQQQQAELYLRYTEAAYLMAKAWEQKRADFLVEASRYVDKANVWNSEAANRLANAGLSLEVANRWKLEGLERRNEFWSILRDKSEYRKRVSSTPVKQPA